MVRLDPLSLGIEIRHDAMPQDRRDDGTDIFALGMIPAMQHGPGLGGEHQILARPRPCAPTDIIANERWDFAFFTPGQAREAQGIASHVLGHGHPADNVL